MRIISFAFSALLLTTGASHTFARSCDGYLKDSRGRTLVYRARPSWWSLPIGAGVGAVGGFFVHDAYNGTGAKKSFFVFDVMDFIRKYVPKLLRRIHIPVGGEFGDTATRCLQGAAGVALTASGAVILYKWMANYLRLNKPIIILEKNGIWYEGTGTISWKDIKSVRLVCDTIADHYGDVSREHKLEIVDTYGRFLISESDLAITVEALYDLVRQYRGWRW